MFKFLLNKLKQKSEEKLADNNETDVKQIKENQVDTSVKEGEVLKNLIDDNNSINKDATNVNNVNENNLDAADKESDLLENVTDNNNVINKCKTIFKELDENKLNVLGKENNLSENVIDKNDAIDIRKFIFKQLDENKLEGYASKDNSFEDIICNITKKVFNENIPEFVFIKQGKNILIKLITEEFNKIDLDTYGVDSKLHKEIFFYYTKKNKELLELFKRNNIDNKNMGIKIVNCMYKTLKELNYSNFYKKYEEFFAGSILCEELLGKYTIISQNRNVKELTFLGEYIYKHKLSKKYYSYENMLNVIKEYENKNQSSKSYYYTDNLLKDILRFDINEVVIDNVKYFDNDTKKYEFGAIGYKKNTVTFYYNGYKIHTTLKKNKKINMIVYKCENAIFIKLSKSGDFVAVNDNNVKLSENVNFIIVGKDLEKNYREFYNCLKEDNCIILKQRVLDIDENGTKYELDSYSCSEMDKQSSSNNRPNYSTKLINEESLVDVNNREKELAYKNIVKTFNQIKIKKQQAEKVQSKINEYNNKLDNNREKHLKDIVRILQQVSADKRQLEKNKIRSIKDNEELLLSINKFIDKYKDLFMDTNSLTYEECVNKYVEFMGYGNYNQQEISLLLFFLISNKKVQLKNNIYHLNIKLEKDIIRKQELFQLREFEKELISDNYDLYVETLSFDDTYKEDNGNSNEEYSGNRYFISKYLNNNTNLNKKERRVLELFLRSNKYTDAEIQEICGREGIKFATQSVMKFMEKFIDKLQSEGNTWISIKVIGISTIEYYLNEEVI